MVAHRPHAHEEPVRHLRVVQPLGHGLDHLVLAVGQGREGGAALIEARRRRPLPALPGAPPLVTGPHGRALEHLPLQHAHARHDGPQGRRDPGDVLLDEVAARPHPQGPHDVLVVGEGGQEDDARPPVAREDTLGRTEPVAARHLDVHEQDVGAQLPVPLHRLGTRSAQAHDVDIRLRRQDGGERLGDQGVVVNNKEPHAPSSPPFGIMAKTVNLGLGVTRTVPPSASTRSVMEHSPRPPPDAGSSRCGAAPSLSILTCQNAG